MRNYNLTRSTILALNPTLIKRFLSKVDIPDPSVGNKCWLWKGAPHQQGYGWIQVKLPLIGHRPVRTSRLAFALQNGEMPKEALACHMCQTPPCCNPSHLILGDHSFNSKDSDSFHRVSSSWNGPIEQIYPLFRPWSGFGLTAHEEAYDRSIQEMLEDPHYEEYSRLFAEAWQ